MYILGIGGYFFTQSPCTCGFHQSNPSTKTHGDVCVLPHITSRLIPHCVMAYVVFTNLTHPPRHTQTCVLPHIHTSHHVTSHTSMCHVIVGRVDQWNWYCYRHTTRSGGRFTTSCIAVYCVHHSLFSVHRRVTTSTTTIPLPTTKHT